MQDFDNDRIEDSHQIGANAPPGKEFEQDNVLGIRKIARLLGESVVESALQDENHLGMAFEEKESKRLEDSCGVDCCGGSWGAEHGIGVCSCY